MELTSSPGQLRGDVAIQYSGITKDIGFVVWRHLESAAMARLDFASVLRDNRSDTGRRATIVSQYQNIGRPSRFSHSIHKLSLIITSMERPARTEGLFVFRSAPVQYLR